MLEFKFMFIIMNMSRSDDAWFCRQLRLDSRFSVILGHLVCCETFHLCKITENDCGYRKASFHHLIYSPNATSQYWGLETSCPNKDTGYQIPHSSPKQYFWTVHLNAITNFYPPWSVKSLKLKSLSAIKYKL